MGDLLRFTAYRGRRSMPSRWFRVYDDLVDDPKVQRLPGTNFKALVNIWCCASRNGGNLPSILDLSYKLRMTPERVENLIDGFISLGLIDKENNELTPHNWARRQYKSDTSTERVKRFRNVSSTVSETAPDTDSTDTETEKTKIRGARKVRGTRLPADWWPTLDNINFAVGKGFDQKSISLEAEKFLNYWTARSDKGATKIDWDATWRNWILNAIERGNGGNGNGRGHKTAGEITREMAEEWRQREREIRAGRSSGNGGSN